MRPGWLRWLALGLLTSLVVAACGTASDDGEGAAPTDEPGEQTGEPATEDPGEGEPATDDAGEDGADLSGESVTFVSYGGSLQEAEETAYVEPFAEETGLEVLSDGPPDYGRIKAMVEGGDVTWSIVHSDPAQTLANCGTLFEPLDRSIVTNIEEIDPQFVTSDCGVPHFQYGFVLMYDEEQFGDNPPETWQDFFDVETYPGRRAVFDYVMSGFIEVSLLADGVPPDELYPLDFERAFAKADTLKDHISWAASPGAVAEMALSGEVSMALIYTSRAYDVTQGGGNWAISWNAPTLVTWTEVAVVKDTPSMDAAMALINNFADAEAQEHFATLIPLSPTNENADPELDETLAAHSVMAQGDIERVFIDQAWLSENFDTVNQQWTDWQAG